MRRAIRTLLLSPLLLAGCGGGGDAGGRPGEDEHLPATDYLTVETGDGLVLVGEVPRIDISEQDGGYAQIEVRGEAVDEANTRLWYFYGRLAEADLLAGFIDAYPVRGSAATTPGIVNVGLEIPPGTVEQVEVARAGSASMDLFDGWLRGQIDNDDPRMAADFAGGYQVSCSYLAPEGGRTVDEAFESDFCRPFAAILPPEPEPLPDPAP